MRSTIRSVRLRWWMRSVIAPIFRPCVAAKATRSGMRAIVPSSFMISQMTAAGVKPAIRARSHPASVWPARTSTPPGCAITGKTWPGCTMSDGFASGATAARTGRARSAAEMPVVTPSAASIDTVKVVPCPERLAETISGSARCRQRSSVNVRQMRPRACRAMKLIVSGVTNSAATTTSPSFSRSSSSTSTTMRPAFNSAMISGVGARVMVNCVVYSRGQGPPRSVGEHHRRLAKIIGGKILDDESRDVRARNPPRTDALDVGQRAHQARRGSVGQRAGTNDGPIDVARAKLRFLPILVLVHRLHEQRLHNPVVEKAAVAAAVACADAGYANEPLDTVFRHRREQELRAPRKEVDAKAGRPDAHGPDDRLLTGDRALDIGSVSGVAGHDANAGDRQRNPLGVSREQRKLVPRRVRGH